MSLKKRIGLVGPPSDWLVASQPNREYLQQRWGVTVIDIDLAELFGAYEKMEAAAAIAWVQDLEATSAKVVEPTHKDLLETARIYLALRSLVNAHELDAVSLRCFDLVTQLETTGCFALAQLNDEGIPAGCEGDLPSTLGLLWAQEITGQLAWMANPARIDVATNRLTLAHCTIPRSLVTGYMLRSHFESGLGVGIQGDQAAGPVTLLRLGGQDLDRIWLAQGELIASGHEETLCRSQAEIQLAEDAAASDLLERPLGNHLVMIPGHHRVQLAEWHIRHITPV